MTTRMEHTSRGRARRVVAFTVFALLSLCLPGAASAQWAANGNNISNTNPGNVGIGTATPTSLLDLQSAQPDVALHHTNNANYSRVLFKEGGQERAAVQFIGSAFTAPGRRSAIEFFNNFGPVLFYTDAAGAGAERMRIDASGKVGIGTATPDALLSVRKDQAAATEVRVANGSAEGFAGLYLNGGFGQPSGGFVQWNNFPGANNLFVGTAGSTPLHLGTNNSVRLTVLPTSGNVGIGTATPTAKLDVFGNGRFSGSGAALTVRNSEGWSQILAQRTGTMQAAFIASPAVANDVSNPYWAMGLSPDGSAGWSLDTWDGSAIITRVRVIPGSGNVGVGTTAPAAKLHVAGDVRVDGNISAKYQDVAEWVPSTQKLSAGTVVVLDTAHHNHVTTTSVPYDTRVAGVISARPGLSLGEEGEGKVLVATTGRVKVRVDATRSPIRVGDLLVTGDTPGVAMRSQPLELGGVPIHRPGTLIGKALEPLEKGTGEILVLLSLQ